MHKSEEIGRRIMNLTGYTDCQPKCISGGERLTRGCVLPGSRCHPAVKEMPMLGTSRWSPQRGVPGYRNGKKVNRGAEGNAIRLSQRLSKVLVLQKYQDLHTVRGRNDERYMIRECVIDQKGFQFGFSMRFHPSHCLVSRDGDEDAWMGFCNIVCCTLESISKGKSEYGVGTRST